MTLQCPIPKILLPVDGSENSKIAIEFTGCLGNLLGNSLTGITLLHATGGSYLGRHIDYVDFRAEILKQSDEFKRIKNEHIEKNILPFMNDGEKTLKELGIGISIEKSIIDGDPADEILNTADNGEFSTIIIGRMGMSDKKDSSIGSITNKVIHTAGKQTVYVVSNKTPGDRSCPIPKILVPVDGSPDSLRSAEHAACLASILKGSLSGVTLLRIINIAHYENRVLKGQHPEKDSQEILDNAKDIFVKSGVSEDLINLKIKPGKPSDEIIKEAEEGGYTLVVIGRRGRSTIKEFVLGGVSSTVLQYCKQSTIAITGGT